MYHKIIQLVCAKYEREYTKDLKVQLYGVTDREICVTLVRELKIPISVDEFEMQLVDLTSKHLPSAPLMEGAERLLTHLHDYKIPMALATNSTQQAVRLHATARPKLFGMFHHKVSVTDPEVKNGKPAPDIYLIAASRFPKKPSPEEVIMIPDCRLDREHTRHATLVIRSMLDFKPELFDLPPFDNVPTKRRIEEKLPEDKPVEKKPDLPVPVPNEK